MKNQNDLIVMIAATVISLGVGLGFFFSKRVPDKPTPPSPVPTEAAKPQSGAVVMSNGLPGASSTGGGGAAGGSTGFTRRRGGPAGAGG